jgi:dynein heavy chain 1
MSVSEWIPDLARRLSQLDGITGVQQNLSNVEVWLGGLFFPEAYITATRQAVAHRKRWSLETLHLRLDIGQMNDPGAFIVDGTLFLSPLFSPNSNNICRACSGGRCLGR